MPDLLGIVFARLADGGWPAYAWFFVVMVLLSGLVADEWV
jgi:hypothetical protein